MTGYLKQYSPWLQFMSFIGIFMGFMLINITLLYTGFPALTDHSIEQLQNADTMADPKVVGYLKLTQFLYTFIVYLLPALLFAYLTDPHPLAWLGLDRKPRWLPIILSLLIMYCSLWAVGITAEWNQHWDVPAAARELEELAEKQTRVLLQMPGVTDLVINLLLIAVLPAVAEELFFRGALQRLIIQLVKRPWWGVLITAIVFSAVHLQLLGFLPRVLLGFLLGAIYLLSGNLWLPIMGHFLNNGMQVVMVYLYQHKVISEDPMETDEVSWYIALISALVTLAMLWLLYKRADRRPADTPDPSR